MSVTRIARAPRSYSSSMTRLRRRARDHGPDGHPARVVQRRDGRRLQAGREREACSTSSTRHVVVHHHVLAGHQDALQPAQDC